MSQLTESILSFLLGFFGLSLESLQDTKNEKVKLFNLAKKAFLMNPHLVPFTEKNGDKNSEHTTTSHNSDSEAYIPVRDNRMPEIPIRLQPIDSKGITLCYLITMDSEKGLNLKQCKAFVELYASKALKAKKTFHGMVSSAFVRQVNEDLSNNTRQRESNKLKQDATLTLAAQPFVSLDPKTWDLMQANEEWAGMNELLIEKVNELRAMK